MPITFSPGAGAVRAVSIESKSAQVANRLATISEMLTIIKNKQEKMSDPYHKLEKRLKVVDTLLAQAKQKGANADKLHWRFNEEKKVFIAQSGRWFGDSGFSKAKTALLEYGVNVSAEKEAVIDVTTKLQKASTAIYHQLRAHREDMQRLGDTKNDLEAEQRKLEKPKMVLQEVKAREARKAASEREGARFVYISTPGADYINNALRQQKNVLYPNTQAPSKPSFGKIYASLNNASYANSHVVPFPSSKHQSVIDALQLPLDKLVGRLDESLIQPYTGREACYRGNRISIAELEKFKEAARSGNQVKFASFVSVTPDRDKALEFQTFRSVGKTHIPVLFETDGYGFYKMQGVTEDEYVAKINQQFKVHSISENEDYVIIKLDAEHGIRNPTIVG